jgi:hypothetical protein
MAFTIFAANLTKSLEPMLARYSRHLLGKICEDYALSYDELSLKYLSEVPLPKVKAPAKKKSAKVEFPQCSGVTAKGGQCTHKAFDESGLCRIHQKKAKEPKAKEAKEPKEKKKPKKVKKGPPPEHTHEPTVSDPLCGLCESHGNPINPELPSTDFESDGLADRLKALILAEGEAEIVKAEAKAKAEAEESDSESDDEAETKSAAEIAVLEAAHPDSDDEAETKSAVEIAVLEAAHPDSEADSDSDSDGYSDYEDEGNALAASLRTMMMNQE